jgi:hypothetical protein
MNWISTALRACDIFVVGGYIRFQPKRQRMKNFLFTTRGYKRAYPVAKLTGECSHKPIWPTWHKLLCLVLSTLFLWHTIRMFFNL